jgi:hypothetical protein
VVLIAGCVLMVLGTVACCVAWREQPGQGGGEAAALGNPIIETLRMFTRIPRAALVAGIALGFDIMAFNPFQVTVNDFFGIDVYHGDRETNVPAYNTGVSFGMVVTCVSCLVAGVSCIWLNEIVGLLGVRKTIGATFLLNIVSFSAAIWTTNRWVLLVFFSVASFSFLIVYAMTYWLVQQHVPPAEMGGAVGVLDVFIEVGGEVALLIGQNGVGSIWKQRGPIIFAGALFALGGVITSFFIVIPPGYAEQEKASKGPPGVRDEPMLPDE